ncbi:MAG: 50S ribosomal protein L22 [Bacteroidetes bacterium QH_2_64_26]|jgi:large subunit ribosomal protein L22|nr:MAG: 50S ribosomal protein L22 [Bacteroidetes bacterium QH_2_64_26]PSQ73362.1 MAG: 50S ribosomal protein L22 [Bacteroidetes bacterium QH_9_64_21]PSQ81901.1 MAG: 50S ribosomal protein L22 [Bacteroidetes bacterium QS_1_63_11]
MQARAVRRYIRSSPLKARRIINLVRDRSVPEAIAILDYMPQKVTGVVEKTIRSAVYNLMDQHEERFDEGALQLKEIRADEGPTFQRHQARARGRAAPIRKRTTHLKVVVEVQEEEPEAAA